VTAVCVTLDERGCAAYWLDENGALAERIVPRIPIEHVVDTTGAGDSFAAGLAFGYLQDADVVRAAQYGNAMGAQRCTGSTLDVYLSLPQTNKQLADTYGTAFEG
jgi:adenosine kinase